MGPPTENPTPSDNSIRNDGMPEDNRRRIGIEKTSLELLLESTDRAPGHPQFGLLRDSILFNQERIRHHQEPTNMQPSTQPSSRFTPLHPINSTSNEVERLLTSEEELVVSPKAYPVSDRSAQNRANANLDRHVGWQLPPPQLPPAQTTRSRHSTNVHTLSLAGDNSQIDTSGDIPLNNTQASLHLPTPPMTNLSEYDTAPLNGSQTETTVTTVYAYKCNRMSKHIGTDANTNMEDCNNKTDPEYEIRTQEVPYPYPMRQQFETVVRESEELLYQSEDTAEFQAETKINSTNLQSDPVYTPHGDYATGKR